jgi:hypothetical protein
VIRAAAVRAFSRPYFSTQIYVEYDPGRVRVCNEDYLFCKRLRDADYDVMLHPGVRCGHYDRGRDRVLPDTWETPDRSNRRRVLVQTGNSYELVPVDEAPKPASGERQLRADVTYIEVGLKD